MKIAVRSLLKSSGFTTIALVTLALGIGVNTTIFTVLNRLLFFPQPFPQAEQLVQVWSTNPGWESGNISPADFFDIRDQNTVFANAALFYVNTLGSIAEAGKPAERSTEVAVSGDFFATMGIQAELGRTFAREEEFRGEGVVVLSHAYWQKHFDGDPKILGRTLRLNAKPVTIVGVMPAILDDPQIWNGHIDLWHLDYFAENRTVRDRAWHSLVARLKPGATLAQAQAEIKTLGARLAHDNPKTNEARGLRAAAYAPDYMGDIGRTLAWLVMAVSVTVLVIACVNLANLQFVRTTGRAREHAIRLALGASRGQLMQLILSESVLLAIVGGAMGLMVAKWGNSYFASYFDSPMPINAPVLAFALAVSTLTGLVSGAIPAWIGSRADVNAALKQGGHGASSHRARHRMRHGLIVVEVALALTLLSGAGYFILGIQRIMHRELHWRPENVLTGAIALPFASYGDETNVRHEVFTEKFLAALRRLPGVDHAALSIGTLAQGPRGAISFRIEGQPPPPPGQEMVATVEIMTPDFLETYGVRLLQGRYFLETDRPGSPRVIIVNRAMAERFWPGESPIGHRISTGGPSHPERYEVVGVAGDVVFGVDFVGQYPRYHFYLPWAQHSSRFLSFSIHSTSDVRKLGDGVRQTLAQIEPDVAVNRMATAEDVLITNVGAFSLVRRTLVELAVLGLLLSVVGIYGVIANLTTERTQEIGIRMALGAQERDVLWLFLRNGILLAGVGTAIGLGLSFGLIYVLSQRISMMPGNDPRMVVGVAAILASVAIFACWLPAQRATKLNPLEALRNE